ncbi:MAG: glutathione S-transferase [Alphaproteobacteria bacterium]|jgi:glutathione S-transferase|nr:glutathione S-transferase [Alphaproteobacteria bacterium]|tara:strand:- start:527 stop:1210 length:684 start_codon:yes stop_codon:yes gene_type:complete
MRTLYHLWLCPYARKVRIALSEKKLPFELEIEKVWERRDEFLSLNPAGEVPVLIEANGGDGPPLVLADSGVICEYLEEVCAEPALVGGGAEARAEVRRLSTWFDLKFQREVTVNLVDEKINKRFLGLGAPSSSAIRAGHANISVHLAYIEFLIERRNWLAGPDFSLADISAAAQISCVDYVGDVPWEDFPEARTWYARIKSRPSLRPILADHIPGIPPPKHYADPDF